VTMWCLAAMLLGTLGVLQWLPADGGGTEAAVLGASGGRAEGVLASFVLLFAAAGIGSSSVFRMIPLIFARLHQGRAGPAPEAAGAAKAAEARAARQAHTEAAATLGFCSAIGAYGGFVIPKSFGTALQWTGSAVPALWMFIAFYLSCIAITWWHYGRHGAALPC
jgi:MFS transporter, NNP family, nitrate/nitrite transporter